MRLPCVVSATAGAMIVFALAMCHAGAADDPQQLEELPLPRWTDDNPEMPGTMSPIVPLGGQLWPEGFSPGDLRSEDGAGSPPGGGVMNASRGDNLLFFIPKASRSAAAAQSKAPSEPLKAVTAEFLRACEDAVPDDYLIDPSKVLHEIQAEDLRRLLGYHAGESKLSAHFLLLEKRETFPASVDLGRLASGRLVSGNTCLVVYPVGEPWRIRFFMSREVTQAVTVKYLGEMMNACVQDSLQVSDPVEQLQRFATQLSIRLIWLERAHPAVFTIQKDPAQIPEGVHAHELLPEVVAEAPAPVVKLDSLEYWKGHAVWAAWGLAAVAAVIILGLGISRWFRRRRRQTVWLIPEVEVKERLGGAHCGGGGASTRYG